MFLTFWLILKQMPHIFTVGVELRAHKGKTPPKNYRKKHLWLRITLNVPMHFTCSSNPFACLQWTVWCRWCKGTFIPYCPVWGIMIWLCPDSDLLLTLMECFHRVQCVSERSTACWERSCCGKVTWHCLQNDTDQGLSECQNTFFQNTVECLCFTIVYFPFKDTGNESEWAGIII